MRSPCRALNAFAMQLLVFAVWPTPLAGHARVASKSPATAAFYYASAGALRCNSNAFWFGKVPVGTTKVIATSLTNTGTAPVTISDISQSGAGFSVVGVNLPVTLAPGQKLNFQISFSPLTAQHVNGTIGFASDASSSILYLPVHGTGTGSPSTVSASPSSLNFGSVSLGSSNTQNEVLTNSGTSSITVSQLSVIGGSFSAGAITLPLTLAPGQSVAVSIGFHPQAAGPASGNVVISSDAYNSTVSIPLAGTAVSPGVLNASAGSLSFGSVRVGSSSSQSETLTNSGGSSLTITQGNASGAGFSVSGLGLPLTLAAGQSFPFGAAFAPSAAGAASGNLSLTSNASNPILTIPLSGSGAAAGVLGATPSSLSFGSVQVGQRQTLSATVTNSGGSSLNISQANVTGSGFTLSGLSLPLTLIPGQSFTFGAVFAPASAGSASGSVAVASDAANPTLTIALSGTGTATTLHNVALSWSPSTSTVAGYNVYRGSASGGPYTKMNSSMATSTTYTDSSVQAGQAYFYVTTAVGTSGAESKYSSQVQALIPGAGGTAGVLAATAPSINFGSLQVGGSSTQMEALTNTGGSSVTISQANVSGSGFNLSGLSAPITLTPGQSYTFGAVFAPTSAGSASGSISVVSNASNSAFTIALSGSGAASGQLVVNPATLNFGSVVVGQSKSMNASLSATGSSITVSSASLSTSEFTLSGMSLPLTVAAGQSVPVTVTFKPQSSGAATANASFASNASNSTLLQSLTGTGAAAPQHSVSLSWSGSGTGVTGYNVYRATVSGGPYSKINSVPQANPSYTDNNVQAGQTYFYVTTALNSSGQQSKYSNQAQAVIPSP